VSAVAVGAPAPGAVLAQAGRENFPVASRVLPRPVRAHLLALYGFARLADDAADEAPGDRVALLDWLEGELDAVYEGAPTHPLMRRLQPTVRACGLPREPFARLLDAGRQDQVVRSYATWAELAAYCARSANPVGELVLHVLGAATPERVALSDAVCTGLQLAEHCQDVAEDLARGRVYLPQADLRRFGVAVADLRAPAAGPRVRALMAFEVARARDLLDRGAPLQRTLRGRPALAVGAFVAGGRAALAAIERARFDVLGGPPRAGAGLRAAWLLRTLARRGAP
jgi:squalene synthase HpnC